MLNATRSAGSGAPSPAAYLLLTFSLAWLSSCKHPAVLEGRRRRAGERFLRAGVTRAAPAVAGSEVLGLGAGLGACGWQDPEGSRSWERSSRALSSARIDGRVTWCFSLAEKVRFVLCCL